MEQMGKEMIETKANSGFDYEVFRQETIAKMLAGDKELTGKDGLLAPLLKDLLDAALSGEMQRTPRGPTSIKTGPTAAMAARSKRSRRATARSAWRCRATATGRLTAPADRPKLIAKRQTTLGEGLDNRILSLYGKGMSYEDIQEHLEELYGLDISTGQLSAITDKILPVVEQWRSRPLEAVYSFVWLDAVHFKVRQDGKVVSMNVEGPGKFEVSDAATLLLQAQA